MCDFFHGWRRKAGCVALLIATIVTFAWKRSWMVPEVVHSYWCRDYVDFIAFRSENGNIRCVRSSWDSGEETRKEEWRIPYSAVAIPLTLLSAYLILWPGKRKPKPPQI